MSDYDFICKVRAMPKHRPTQKRLRSMVRDNEERFRAIVDSSRQWEYLVEADGHLGYVSPASEIISGYSSHEFEQNPRLLQAILYPEDRAVVGGHFPESAGAANETSLEFRIVTKSGEVRWIQHHCHPIFTRTMRYVGLLANNYDITIRKQIELEQLQAEKRLKQLAYQLITIQEAERRRISQDLHDDTGQGMTALLLCLNAIYTGWAVDQQQVKPQLQEAIHLVETLMNQVRQLAYQLRPPSLDSMPLSKALESLCSSFGHHAGLHIDYSSDKDLPPVPNLQATALYRLVQEGVNNAIKYAKATSVWVSLDYVDGEVSLSVEDNGQGFDLKKVGEGMGLLGLQERFRLLNGGLEIESAPSVGTRLYGYLPLASHSL
jgi:two-component system sensor histidine kinase UhpB